MEPDNQPKQDSLLLTLFQQIAGWSVVVALIGLILLAVWNFPRITALVILCTLGVTVAVTRLFPPEGE